MEGGRLIRRGMKGIELVEGVNHIITVTTDFGGTFYQGILEGAIYSVNPAARVVNVSRYVRPHDVQGAAFIMKTTLPHYPYSVHLGVVFPTFGTPGARNIVVQCKRGIVVGPDNGILIPAAKRLGLEAVYEISNPRFWLSAPSAAFLADDFYGPLAAYLSMGLRPKELGPQIYEWNEMEEPKFRVNGTDMEGEIVYIDNFGNIITNIPGREVARVARYNEVLRIELNGRSLRLPLLKSYGYAPKGGMLATLNSNGLLEIAAYCDSASRLLEIDEYVPVRLRSPKEARVLESLTT